MQVHPFELLSSLSLGHTERVLGFYNLAIKWEDSIILGSSAWTYSQHIWREDFMRICWRNNTTSSTWALSSRLLQRQASYAIFQQLDCTFNKWWNHLGLMWSTEQTTWLYVIQNQFWFFNSWREWFPYWRLWFSMGYFHSLKHRTECLQNTSAYLIEWSAFNV